MTKLVGLSLTFPHFFRLTIYTCREVLRGPKKVEAGDDVPTEAVLVSNDS